MGDYIKPKIFGYDKTIYKFIEKYKNNDFKEKYKAKIKALNQEILNSNNNDNIISYLLNNDERNKLFFQNGGNKYMFETGEELYNMSAHDLSERDFMFDENKISNTYNVLVIGGGPIGLFNAIILKTKPDNDDKLAITTTTSHIIKNRYTFISFRNFYLCPIFFKIKTNRTYF